MLISLKNTAKFVALCGEMCFLVEQQLGRSFRQIYYSSSVHHLNMFE